MDTPSGPAGRRARWHETLSKFDLTVQYICGKDNVVADAMSRFAYPACKAFQDTSFHGSEAARLEMKEIIQSELEEGNTIALIRWTDDDDHPQNIFMWQALSPLNSDRPFHPPKSVRYHPTKTRPFQIGPPSL